MRNPSKRQSYETAHLGTILKDSLQTIFAISRGLSESYRRADFLITLKRIRAAHWHILYCCIHCRNGYGCTHVRFYQRNVTIETAKLMSLPVSYAHSKIKINSNQEKHVLFLLQFQSTVSGSYFLVRWVISLPSVWRSSITRSWSPVTITWSIAIAGSWSKNLFHQMIWEIF